MIGVEGDDKYKSNDTSYGKAEERQPSRTKVEVVLFFENVGESCEKAVQQAKIEGDINAEKPNNLFRAQHGNWPFHLRSNEKSNDLFGWALRLRMQLKAYFFRPTFENFGFVSLAHPKTNDAEDGCEEQYRPLRPSPAFLLDHETSNQRPVTVSL